MPAFTSIAIAASAGAAIVGTGVAGYGMMQQQKAQKEGLAYQQQAIDAQQKAEQARKAAMNLDASRRRREVVRNQVAANAQSQTAANASGAGLGSGLPGAYGGISGRSGVNEAGINQNQELGNTIFKANAAAGEAYRGVAEAGTAASTAAGMFSLGNALVANSETIGKVGGYFFPSRTA